MRRLLNDRDVAKNLRSLHVLCRSLQVDHGRLRSSFPEVGNAEVVQRDCLARILLQDPAEDAYGLPRSPLEEEGGPAVDPSRHVVGRGPDGLAVGFGRRAGASRAQEKCGQPIPELAHVGM